MATDPPPPDQEDANIVIYDGWCPTHGLMQWWVFPPQKIHLCGWVDDGDRCQERLDVRLR